MSAVELLTPSGAGAVAIILIRRGAGAILPRLTGRTEWPIGRVRLVDLGGADEGLAVRFAPDAAWLMPHGGAAVTRAVLRAARDAAGEGVDDERPAEPEDAVRWPEAADAFEAAMLELMAGAASPLALSLLAEQPERWRHFAAEPAAAWTTDDAARSRRLDRLLDPPSVVLAGPPNIGKSTLANALAGRTVSITADEPGTTRDAPCVGLDLAGLVVHWHDAPGLRRTSDAIERTAIDRAADLLATADLLVAAADATSDWPALPRSPDLRVGLRPDLGGRDDADLLVGGRDGTGLADLAVRVRDALVPPADRGHDRPWDARGVFGAIARARGGTGAAPGGTAQKPIDEMPQST